MTFTDAKLLSRLQEWWGCYFLDVVNANNMDYYQVGDPSFLDFEGRPPR